MTTNQNIDREPDAQADEKHRTPRVWRGYHTISIVYQELGLR